MSSIPANSSNPAAGSAQSADREAELVAAMAALRARLVTVAQDSGRNVADIELVAVTKFFPVTDVVTLWRLGCRNFGESRDQEAVMKVAEFAAMTDAAVSGQPVRWHMVGQIQRNKAKHIAVWADTVHSVSTAPVVTALDRECTRAISDGQRAATLRTFVQISLDGDPSRGGVHIADSAAVDRICAQIADASGLELAGLMAIPPVNADADAAFSAVAAERSRVLHHHPDATGLSTGMSDDMDIAVRHGSTCVRVGTALLGKRPLTSP